MENNIKFCFKGISKIIALGGILLLGFFYLNFDVRAAVVFPSVVSSSFVGTAIQRPNYDYGPSIINDGGTFRMYWCRENQTTGNGDAIWYAESANGISWSGIRMVLEATPNSEENENQSRGHTCDPSVIKVDSSYYLYYTAASFSGVNNQIFLARSSDGISWTKHPSNSNPQPVIRNTIRSGQYGIGQSIVFYRNNQFSHYYTDTDRRGSMLATSNDGINWTTANNGKPVIVGPGNVIPTYLLDYNVFLAVRANDEINNTGMDYYFSSDGISWTRAGTLNIGNNRGSIHNAGILTDTLGLVSGSSVLAYYGAGGRGNVPLPGGGIAVFDASSWDIDITRINFSPPQGTIQGFKVKMPENQNVTPPAGETVRLDGGSPTTANPYFFTSVAAGAHSVSVTVPSGWSVGHTLCHNRTDCHGDVPISGSAVSVNVPAGGFADLWWHYTPPPPSNQPPVADAKISTTNSNFTDSVTVTRGVATTIFLSASQSSDPDGWTSANGVSNGGKCEWNSDLNQGSPTFERVINNPSFPSACNISLGILTFNDTPGTHTYQVLKITDNRGATSNIDTVQVTVVTPATPPPPPPPPPPSPSEHNLSGWAWSETIGWISFNSTNQDISIPEVPRANYGVTVDKSGNLSGYAWSEHIGWISFNQDELVGCPASSCQAILDRSSGKVEGWARAYRDPLQIQIFPDLSGGWDGWIHLRGSNYGVNVSGCNWDGWAWGSDVVGWIHFGGSNYGVKGNGDACLPLSLTFTGNPTTINQGKSALLEWSSQNTTSCTASADPQTKQWSGEVSPNNGRSDAIEIRDVTPSQTTKYTLSCKGPGGKVDGVVTITVNPSEAENQAPKADAKISACPVGDVVCIQAFSDSVTVARGVPTQISFSADGSSDPDGWTSANGVSSGGKCEWNRDLNQGIPTFEPPPVNNPNSPSACNISLGTLTFNDPPGTYTYQVLRITDNKGAVSNVDTVRVKVIAPPTGGFSCNSSGQCVFGGGGASSCQTNANCPGSGFTCNTSGQCVIGGGGASCTSNASCGGTDGCVGNCGGGGGGGGGCTNPATCPRISALPTASQLGSDTSFFCPSHQVQMSWQYSDPNSDPQASFRLQLDDDPNFGSMQIDVYKDSSDKLYITPANVLALATKYHFRVAVKDATGKWSDWSAASNFITPASCVVTPPPPPPPPVPQCKDKLDNDGDGKKDFPQDPGCLSLDDDDERDPEFREI